MTSTDSIVTKMLRTRTQLIASPADLLTSDSAPGSNSELTGRSAWLYLVLVRK